MDKIPHGFSDNPINFDERINPFELFLAHVMGIIASALYK